jgi:two-component system, LytTR family, sensor kinase
MRRPTTSVVGIVLVFATILGSLEAFSYHLGMERLGRPITWSEAFLGTLPGWLIKGLLSGPVLLLTRVARLGPATWPTRLPIHVLGAAAFVVATPIANALVNAALGRLGDEPVHAAATRYFWTYLAYEVAMYATLVGAFHALDYLRESEQRERERARLAASLTEARLDALRSQLSPHFFYNTLNAISTFALQGRPTQVADMVGALGDLVRVSLDEELGHSVTLERELEFLDLYLDIQRVRFADWLRIEIEVDPAARDALVPSLVLQPLVENAIEHGAPGADGFVRVGVRCDVEADSLRVEVVNRGRAREASSPPPREGVGLGNTRARLEQLHPGRHEFRFGAVEGGGFRVAFRIPLVRDAVGVAS